MVLPAKAPLSDGNVASVRARHQSSIKSRRVCDFQHPVPGVYCIHAEVWWWGEEGQGSEGFIRDGIKVVKSESGVLS